MTLLPRALAASLLIASLVACSGSEGPRGEDGAPGKDGENGENGENGAPGKDGENGAPGEDGETGAPGEDGEDGEDGETGAPGEDGEDASDTASPMVVRGVVAHEIEAVGAEMLAVSADGRYGLAAGKDVATYFEIGPARLEVIGTLTLPTEHYPEGSSVADFTGLSIHPSGDYALIAVRDIDPANMDFSAIFDEVPGKVIAVSLPDLTVLGEVEVGRGPDSVAIAKNGEFAVVANEDEEDETNLTDLDNRAGSLSVIDLRDGPTNLAQVFVPLESEDLPFFGHDPQPETVKIAPDDSFIVATLQENNAITRVDVQSPLPSPLMADAFTVTHFDAGTRRGLGLVSGGAGSDSCASSSYDLSLREVYFSAREPDGIAVTPDGRFLVTADEDNIIALNDQSWEGEPISPHGSRSISVYDAETGEFLGDSGETIEEGITARQLPMRCSSKGPEPEVVSVGEVNGRTLAFVSLERSDAISIHDVTDPENLLLLDVVPLNPSVIAADEGPQYEPEGIEFIPGRNLVVVSSPEAARLTLVELRLHDVIGDVVIPEGDPASIVISEVNSDLAPDDWIELHNQGPLAVNLTGFSFTDDDPTHVYTFPAGTVLGAGEFLVVGTPDDFSFGLGGEDAVYLYSADEALLDSFQWGETTSPWGENHVATVSRCVNPSAAAGYSFWPTTGEQGLGSPTPGEANDCLPPSVAGQSDVVLNEIRTQGDDFVELYNRGASTIDLSGWRLGDEGGGMFVFPAATTIDPGAFLVVEGDWTTGPLALTFGLGSGDSATLLSPYDVVVDTTAWTSHQNTGSRCPDGTGTFVSTTETKGSANLCP